MSIQSDNIAEAGQRFRHECADHKMTVLHDDGLYRHLRFSNPEDPFTWFDLVTWPGTLAVKGGMGTFVFSREKDMFAFFRASNGGVNPGYWAEKLPGGRDDAREYDEAVLRAALAEPLADHEREYPNLLTRYRERKAQFDALPYTERYPYAARGMREPVEPKTADEIRELISGYDDDGLLSFESGARDLLDDLERADVVADTFEWNLREYTVFYLWSCHAIAWGIGQYDAAKAAAPAYLIWSNHHQMWWRANSAGYTPDERKAGLYTKADAERECSLRSRDDQLPPEVMILRPSDSVLGSAQAADVIGKLIVTENKRRIDERAAVKAGPR